MKQALTITSKVVTQAIEFMNLFRRATLAAISTIDLIVASPILAPS